jgi:hypothetical protein
MGDVTDLDALAALEEQRRFLAASLDDLAREHEAGDLDEGDHRSLAADYGRRLEAVERAIAAGLDRRSAPRPVRSPWRYLLVVAGVLAFAVLAGVLVAQASGRREPGEQITGADPRTSGRQALASCLRHETEGDPSESVDCYQQAIEDFPDEAGLLAYYGWFLFRLGTESSSPELAATGVQYVDRAVKADPEHLDGRAFQVIVLTRSGRLDDARLALAALDELDPPAAIRDLLAPIRRQLTP